MAGTVHRPLEPADPLLAEAAAGYEEYVGGQVEGLLSAAKTFTDAVRAGDVTAAKAAYAKSRQAWERIEPVASLVEELDGKLDARVDDFSGVDDEEFTGWHRLEYQLWQAGTIDDKTKKIADQLDNDLVVLKKEIAELEISPAVIAVGSAELIEEAANGKMTGEEDRYSKTDLWDIAANVEGSAAAFKLLEPALKAKDADIVADIEKQFDEVVTAVDETRQGEGFKGFDKLTDGEKNKLKAALAELSEQLSQMAGVLGLS